MSTKARPAAGGGRTVEVPPERLVGWVNRFAARHGGIADPVATSAGAELHAADGATALLRAPFGPVAGAGAEPIEAILAHIDRIGDLAVLLARGADHSIGVARDGVVIVSSTDARYLQGRTAAGGWSQQRFARRRENQRKAGEQAAARTALRVWADHRPTLAGLAVGGARHTYDAILADAPLAWVAELPRRELVDTGAARRAELDRLAARALTVEITVVDGDIAKGR